MVKPKLLGCVQTFATWDASSIDLSAERLVDQLSDGASLGSYDCAHW